MFYDEKKIEEIGFSEIKLPITLSECQNALDNISIDDDFDLSKSSKVYSLNIQSLNKTKLNFLHKVFSDRTLDKVYLVNCKVNNNNRNQQFHIDAIPKRKVIINLK